MDDVKDKIQDLYKLIPHSQRYTFIGAKINTNDTISSLVDPILIKTDINFKSSKKNRG